MAHGDSSGAPLFIHSRYLRERLSVDPPTEENLDVYRDLLRLESLCLEPPRSWSAGMLYGFLRDRYPVEFAEIARELSPDLHRAELARQEKRREDIARFERQARAKREVLLSSLRRAAHQARPEEGDRGSA